jgi:hypothetical protein
VGEGLIWLTSISGYIGVAATAYRVQYIKTYKDYRRWQAAKPNEIANLDYDVGYGFLKKERKNVDYWGYFHATDVDRMPPYHHWMWPVLFLVWIFWKFLHPEVKVPDVQQIDKLEKELKELEG